MSGFSDYAMSWGGVDYVIPKARVMGAIAAVEEHVSFPQVHAMLGDPEKIKLVKLACAFGALLRYAGAEVKDEQVYEGMFQTEDRMSSAVVALWALLKLMLPDSVINKATETAPAGNAGRQAPKTAGRLSSKPSKRRAAPRS